MLEILASVLKSQRKKKKKGKKGVGEREKKRCAADLSENRPLPCPSVAGLI